MPSDWQPLATRSFKLNVNVAIFEEKGTCIGMMVQNDVGQVMIAVPLQCLRILKLILI